MASCSSAVLLSVCLALHLSAASSAQPPNIVFILADDLGWNDVSFHGSQQIPTPNLDTLAYDGILLGNYYVQPICTPTRGSIMTGRHPIHTGLQSGVINAAEPWGLGLDETIMPQYLKELGYATHIVGKESVINAAEPWGLGLDEIIMPQYLKELGYATHIVGKWHLGFFEKEYTPLYRGFDSHRGYYQGCGDYWDHTYAYNKLQHDTWGLDFWKDHDLDKTAFGQYSTEIFTSEAEHIIQEHDTEKPLYLYLAHQAIHSGNPETPLEAPWKYLKNFGHINDKNRRTVAAMVSALDDSVGNVTKALADRGILNNTIIVFTTDNGGPAHGFDFNHANNWPLRGVKATLWEGGVRGSGFVWSPLLKGSPYTSHQMLQVIDWLPTLLHAAGYNMSKLPHNIDGMDQWGVLGNSAQAAYRTEMLHNIHATDAALRIRDLKIIQGEQYGGWDGWYPPEGVTTPSGHSLEAAPAHMFKSTLDEVLRRIGRKPRKGTPLVVDCGPKPANASTNCDVKNKVCLYNITADPCEFNNLAEQLPDDLEHLLQRLEYYRATAVPPRNKPNDPAGDPIHHGGAWVPWLNLTDTERAQSSMKIHAENNPRRSP